MGRESSHFADATGISRDFCLRWWFVIVVGQEEFDARSVNVRNRDDVGTKARSETIPLDDVVQKLMELKESRSLHNKLV
jgi:threonyl-tRNA synthetase